MLHGVTLQQLHSRISTLLRPKEDPKPLAKQTATAEVHHEQDASSEESRRGSGSSQGAGRASSEEKLHETKKLLEPEQTEKIEQVNEVQKGTEAVKEEEKVEGFVKGMTKDYEKSLSSGGWMLETSYKPVYQANPDLKETSAVEGQKNSKSANTTETPAKIETVSVSPSSDDKQDAPTKSHDDNEKSLSSKFSESDDKVVSPSDSSEFKAASPSKSSLPTIAEQNLPAKGPKGSAKKAKSPTPARGFRSKLRNPVVICASNLTNDWRF